MLVQHKYVISIANRHCVCTQVVCDFCREHLPVNQAAFASPRLTLINDDARAQLEKWPTKFDVIIGDLADPLDGGPCYQLYTQVGAVPVQNSRLNDIRSNAANQPKQLGLVHQTSQVCLEDLVAQLHQCALPHIVSPLSCNNVPLTFCAMLLSCDRTSTATWCCPS